MDLKTIVIIEDSPFTSDRTETTVRCKEYKIYRPSWTFRDILEVVRHNGSVETYIHMTEVREIVWERVPREGKW